MHACRVAPLSLALSRPLSLCLSLCLSLSPSRPLAAMRVCRMLIGVCNPIARFFHFLARFPPVLGCVELRPRAHVHNWSACSSPERASTFTILHAGLMMYAPYFAFRPARRSTRRRPVRRRRWPAAAPRSTMTSTSFLGHSLRFLGSTPPHIRRVMCSTECPCLSGADWPAIRRNPNSRPFFFFFFFFRPPGDFRHAKEIAALGPLPEGWSSGQTAEGETYYVDHANKVGCWAHPTPPSTCPARTTQLP